MTELSKTQGIDEQFLTETQVEKAIYRIFGLSVGGVFVYILLTSVIFDEKFEANVFRFHIGSFYPYFLILGLILIIFSLLLLFRNLSMGHSSLNILTSAVFLSGLSYVFGFLNFDPTGTTNFRETRLFQLQILSQTISIFLIYLHYELNSHSRPRTPFLSLNIILLWPYSFFNIYHLITNNYATSEIVNEIEFFSLLLLQVGVIIIFGWLLMNAIGISKIFLKRSDETSRAAAFQLTGIFILVLGIVFQLVETVSPLVDVWHTPLNTVAIFLIGFPYLRHPSVMIFSPVNVLLLGVVDSYGRTMYFKPVDPSFANDEALETTSDLFGGLTLAFSSMGKEVAKSEKGVDSLEFADRSIIVEYSTPYYLVVIANTSTYYLQLEMEEYLDELKNEYPNVPKDGSIIPQQVFEQLNRKFFPIIIQVA